MKQDHPVSYEFSKIVVGQSTSFPINSIKEAPYNPRELDESAEKVLGKTLDKFGMVEWIVVNKKTSHIVAGHQRFKLLKKAGETHVPVLFIDVDEKREKTINVTMNNDKIEGEFDHEKLALMQDELKDGPDFADLEIGLVGTGLTLRNEGAEVEIGEGKVDNAQYLKVFRLHFTLEEWAEFEENAKKVMVAHQLKNYSELVLFLAQEYAV